MIGEVKGVCVLLEHQAHWGAALWGPATGLLSAQLGVRSGGSSQERAEKDAPWHQGLGFLILALVRQKLPPNFFVALIKILMRVA